MSGKSNYRRSLFYLGIAVILVIAVCRAAQSQDSNPPVPNTIPNFSQNAQPLSPAVVDQNVVPQSYVAPTNLNTDVQFQRNSQQQSPTTTQNPIQLAPATSNAPPPAYKYNPQPLAGPGAAATKNHTSGGYGSFFTMILSLGFVLGLFWVTVKLLNRGGKSGGKSLPKNVVEVLGNAPMLGRQSLQVIRFGNKILLVAVSPAGYDTLTEITDPLEVDRLAGMCHANSPHSSTSSFTEILGQLTSWRPKVANVNDRDDDQAETRSISTAAKFTTRDPLTSRTNSTREVPRA
jgi:flagellar biogenesis protein FliO